MFSQYSSCGEYWIRTNNLQDFCLDALPLSYFPVISILHQHVLSATYHIITFDTMYFEENF